MKIKRAKLILVKVLGTTVRYISAVNVLMLISFYTVEYNINEHLGFRSGFTFNGQTKGFPNHGRSYNQIGL